MLVAPRISPLRNNLDYVKTNQSCKSHVRHELGRETRGEEDARNKPRYTMNLAMFDKVFVVIYTLDPLNYEMCNPS